MTAGTRIDSPTPGSLRLVLTLAIAGLISGLAIIGIYESTLPTITANKARELREAVFKVLPGVSQMQPLVFRDGALVAAAEPSAGESVVYGGYDDGGRFVGYAIPGAGPGFQDTIGLLYGFDAQRRQIMGMEVLESRETPGLGDKIYKDMDFVDEFYALAIEPEIVAVKKGTKTADNHVDAITGATISSKAVVRIINETHAAWAGQLPPAGNEPALESQGGSGAGP
jgi:electron transport complex protein RnfG